MSSVTDDKARSVDHKARSDEQKAHTGMQLLGFTSSTLTPWVGIHDQEGDDVGAHRQLAQMQPKFLSVSMEVKDKVRILTAIV